MTFRNRAPYPPWATLSARCAAHFSSSFRVQRDAWQLTPSFRNSVSADVHSFLCRSMTAETSGRQSFCWRRYCWGVAPPEGEGGPSTGSKILVALLSPSGQGLSSQQILASGCWVRALWQVETLSKVTSEIPLKVTAFSPFLRVALRATDFSIYYLVD